MLKKTFSLSSLKIGDCGRVVDFLIDGDFRRKLLGIGIYPGVRLKVLRAGPFGNPVELLVDDNLFVAVRRREARNIIIEPCNEKN